MLFCSLLLGTDYAGSNAVGSFRAHWTRGWCLAGGGSRQSRPALTRVTLPDDAPDYERCPPVRVDETTCEPDYALLFDGVHSC